MIGLLTEVTISPKGPIQLWTGIVAFVVLLFLVLLVRKNHLKASYSLLWFGGWTLCAFFIVFPPYLDVISKDIFGIEYSPTMLLLMMIMTLGLIILHLTTVITRQSKQINVLAQEMALLKEKL